MSQPVSELSDQDLLEELCDYGATPGPILPSTRSLYERKLMKLRGAPEESLTPKHRYEEVPDDEENSPPPRKRSPKPVRKRVVPKRPEPLNIERDEQVENDLPHSQDTTTEPEKEKSGRISMIMKIFVFLIVAFFVYLIIKNMEPARRVPLN